MGNFYSVKGKWYASKERIALKNKSDKPFKYKGETINPGDDFIYQGPDREALKAIHLSGNDHLGTDFRQDPEFRQFVRQQGFEKIEDYLKYIGYDEKADEEKLNKHAEVVNKHQMDKKVKEIKVIGGGKDTSGNSNNDLIGGFGVEKERKPQEVS